MCLRAGVGAKWRATVRAGAGLRAHLRNIERISIVAGEPQPGRFVEDMAFGTVLTLGMGLQRQIGDVSLGVDFQIRRGVPAEYRSVEALLSAGIVLDQGD